MSAKPCWHWSKTVAEPTTLIDFVATESAISKSLAKKVLAFGGGWVRLRGNSKPRRCRRAQQALAAGDIVDFYFDEKLLTASYPPPVSLVETPNWGIWYKPAGVLAQGSPYGDRGCMDVEIQARRSSAVFLIHRLDREAAGVMVFAYHKQAAARLSELWASNRVEKIYQAEVVGPMPDPEGRIEIELDGKPAATRYAVSNSSPDCSQVTVTLETGRYHQIRRHFAHIGHPLLGDPRYGRDNKNREGLRLCAVGLNFICPLTKRPVHYLLPPELRLFE